MICQNCGRENPEGAKFCTECGHSLLRPADDATITFAALDLSGLEDEHELSDQLEELASGDAMLIVTRGPNSGATYLLDTDIVRAGRNPDNDIFFDDVTVSRKHAEFRRENGHFSLTDVGSLNGTYVNNERVDSSPLANGDEVQIGAFKLVFLTGPLDR